MITPIFFHLDSMETITDEHLYEQLLDEFPMWLKGAKEKKELYNQDKVAVEAKNIVF